MRVLRAIVDDRLSRISAQDFSVAGWANSRLFGVQDSHEALGSRLNSKIVHIHSRTAVRRVAIGRIYVRPDVLCSYPSLGVRNYVLVEN